MFNRMVNDSLSGRRRDSCNFIRSDVSSPEEDQDGLSDGDFEQSHMDPEKQQLRNDIIQDNLLIEELTTHLRNEQKALMEEERVSKEQLQQLDATIAKYEAELKGVRSDAVETKGDLRCLSFGMLALRMLQRTQSENTKSCQNVLADSQPNLEESALSAVRKRILQVEEEEQKQQVERENLLNQNVDLVTKLLQDKVAKLQRELGVVRNSASAAPTSAGTTPRPVGNSSSTAPTSAGTTPRYESQDPANGTPLIASTVASVCTSTCASTNGSPAVTPRVDSLEAKGKGMPPVQKDAAAPKGVSGKGGAVSTGAPKGGKGLPPPPKPPMAKPPPAKAGAKAKATGPALPASNGLVNLAWKPTAEPKPEDLSLSGDDMLSSLLENLDPEIANTGIDDTCVYVTDPSNRVPELSAGQLQDWFSLKPAAEKTAPSATSKAASSGGSSCNAKPSFLPDKVAKKAEMQITRYRMKSSNTKMSDADVVNRLFNDVLKCNSGLATLESLLSIVAENRAEGSPITKFVAENGVAALSTCEAEFQHRLVYSISEIPDVEVRLQCLIFEATFPEAQRKCHKDLEVLHDGMKVLVAKREACRKFFQTALHLGNELNKDRRGLVASRGFQLASLPKLHQCKSPMQPNASLFHVVLSLLEPSDVKKLAEKVSVLAAARDRKCSGVSERCQELLSGLLKVEQQANSVKKQMRKRAVSSAEASKADGQSVSEVLEQDPTDKFHSRMSEFLKQSRNSASHIAQLHQDVFETYWELAVYFEDPYAVYPPPKTDTDAAQDIFQVFHEFAEAVATASKHLGRLGLREQIAEAEAESQAASKDSTQGPSKDQRQTDIKVNAASTSTSSEEFNVNVRPLPQKQTPLSETPRLFSASTPEKFAKSRKASPSPTPQSTTLQRLRDRSTTNASARSGSASRQLTANPVVAKRSSFIGDDDDDGQQSDVSDWENSPKKATSPVKRTVAEVTRANTSPEVVSSRSSRPAIPVDRTKSEASLSLGPPPKRAPSFDSRSSPAPKAKNSLALAHSSSDNLASPVRASPPKQVIDFEELHTSPMPPCRPPPSMRSSGGKKERNRKSISAVADRLSSALVSRMMGGGDSSDYSENDDEAEIEVVGSPQRRRRSLLSLHDRNSSLSPPPLGKFMSRPPRKSDSLATELKKEIRRRSLSSRGAPRTPNRKTLTGPVCLAGLTPVAEPGETPISDTPDSDREPRSRELLKSPETLDPNVLSGMQGAGLRPEAFGSSRRRLNW